MFPDRIDKMILDGVQNPQEYYNGNVYVPLHIARIRIGDNVLHMHLNYS
jgi:hypothetical protein